MSQKIILDKLVTFMLEPGIIENAVHANVVLDENDILKLKEANRRIAEGKDYALLIVSSELSTTTKEGREIGASEKHKGNNIATALLIDSLSQSIIGNFYLTVNKPATPTRIFNDREKALLWLREKVQQISQK